MKIIYHHRTLGQGVEGVHISGVIGGFITAGHDVVEVSLGDSQATNNTNCKFSDDKSEPKKKNFLSFFVNKAPNFVFRIAEIFYNLVGFLKLRKVIKKTVKPDFIYDRYAYFSFVSVVLGKLYKIPVITEVNITTDFEDTRKVKFQYLCRSIEQFVLKKSDLIIVVSSALKEKLLAREIESNKIFVQPNGFNPDYSKINVTHIVRNSVLEDSSEKLVLCFLGRLLPWYQLDKLLEIVAQVKKQYDDLVLLVIGDGSEKAKLEAYSEKLGLKNDVFFTGNVSHGEALSLLAYSDICLLLATNYWTSPVKLFEYMGAGKAVIAPNIESITAIMEDGTHGKLFVDGDFVDFRKGLVNLLENRASLKEIGNNCRHHIEQNHTWVQVSKNILSTVINQNIQK